MIKKHASKIISGSTLSILLLTGTFSIFAPAANANEAVPSSFSVEGGGWGHGVGMSQFGAQGMALDKKSAKQILEHYYNPAVLTSTTSHASSDIKVNLVKNQNNTKITPSGGKIRIKDGKQTIESSSPITFQVSGSNINYTVDNKTYTVANSTVLTVEWEGTRFWNPNSNLTTVNVPLADDGYRDGIYRHGKIELKTINNRLNVNGVLRMNDEYLNGLAEIPSSWETEALKAQAIAGRTYAMRNMNKVKNDCDCNVYDEVQSQKYTGWRKENEGTNASYGKRWQAAVSATQTKNANNVPLNAQVVMYKNALIDAVYSSATGGKTRAAKDVWGNHFEYLQSRDDSWGMKQEVKNPNAAWTINVSQATMKNAFNLKDVKTVTFTSENDGAIKNATATASNGAKSTIAGTVFRSKTGMKAAWIKKINGSAGTTTPPITTNPLPNENTLSGEYKTTANLNFRVANNTTASIISTIPSGTTIKGYETSGTWLKVVHNGKAGWVSNQYLQKVVVVKPPVVKPPVTVPPVTKPPVVKPPVAKPPVTNASTGTYETTANLNVRKSNNTKAAIIKTLPKGTKVTGYKLKTGWRFIKFGNQSGWVSNVYLKKPSTTPPVTKPPVNNASTGIYTTKANLNMRKSNSTNSAIISTIKKGTKVTGYQTSNGWRFVKINGKSGWMSNQYLSK